MGGGSTCLISTDKLISRSGALFLDERRKKELGAGGESAAQVNCETQRDFPVAANRLLLKELSWGRVPFGRPGKV